MAGSPSIAVKVLADLKGFTTAVSGAGTHVDGVTTKMRTAFSGVTGALNQTGVLGPFQGVLDGINTTLDTIGDKAKGLGDKLLGAGAAAVGVGAGLSAFGSKDQAAQQQLQQAIENTGGSYEDYSKSVEDAIGHQENYGHTANETMDALSKLTDATHDPQKALDLLGEASDIAASKHEDLTTAADQLGKVYNGNTKLLKPFGIELDKTTGLTKDGKTAVQALADVTAGQAAAATDTFSGKLDALKTKLEDQIALFGEKWGPAIQVAGGALVGLGAAIDIVSTAYDGMAISETVALGWMAAIVLAVALIVIAIVILYQKWDEVWKWFGTLPWYAKVALVLLLLISGVGEMIVIIALLAVYWSDAWKVITTVAGWAWDHILHPVFTFIGDAVVLMAKVIGTTFQIVKKFVEDWLVAPFAWAWDEIKKFVGWIIDKVDAVVGKIGSIPGASAFLSAAGAVAGSPAAIAGLIPGIASGGIVTHPTLALIGEAGPEAVIPLNQLGSNGRSGPVVHIDNVNLSEHVDVDLFTRRVAWMARTQAV